LPVPFYEILLTCELYSVFRVNVMGNPSWGSAKGENWIPLPVPDTDHLKMTTHIFRREVAMQF